MAKWLKKLTKCKTYTTTAKLKNENRRHITHYIARFFRVQLSRCKIWSQLMDLNWRSRASEFNLLCFIFILHRHFFSSSLFVYFDIFTEHIDSPCIFWLLMSRMEVKWRNWDVNDDVSTKIYFSNMSIISFLNWIVILLWVFWLLSFNFLIKSLNFYHSKF